MPSRTKKQARLMGAIAHGWKPPAASGIDVPVGVAKEFNAADKGTKRLSQAMKAASTPPKRAKKR